FHNFKHCTMKAIHSIQHTVNSFIGKDPDLSKYDYHVAASLLERYFRSLDQGVIPEWFFDHYKQHRPKTVDERVKMLTDLASQLPVHVQKLLRFVLRYLEKLESFSNITKMTSDNLAIVWGPLLLDHPSIVNIMQMLSDTPLKSEITHLMILNASKIFPEVILIWLLFID